jgi:hypothetical protein
MRTISSSSSTTTTTTTTTSFEALHQSTKMRRKCEN